MSLIPIFRFDRIDNAEADERLTKWEHWLGPCNRPFTVQSFGLFMDEWIVAVAVSASTVNASCGGWKRNTVCELARLCAAPDQRDLTRVCLRLWRKVAWRHWKDWQVEAYVSYANAIRHKGDIYRFDGWEKVAEVSGGTAGGGWQIGKSYDPKSVWVYKLGVAS